MATNDSSAKPGHRMAADITVASKITTSTELAPKITGTENQQQQPASLQWVAELAKEDPDYEIDSDGHWTPRQRAGWTKEELAAADAAYQRTTQGLEPCTKCEGRKTFCYKCDNYECHERNQGKCPCRQ